MVAPASPRRGTVSELTNRLLDRSYEQIVRPVLNSIVASTQNGLIAQRLAELDAEAARLAAANQQLAPDNPVLRALLADLETELARSAARLDAIAQDVQVSGADAAGTIQRQLALPGITDTQLRAIGIQWQTPDPEAVARLVTYAQSDSWAAELARFPDLTLDTLRNIAVQGIIRGWGPMRTAEEILRTTTALPAHIANNLVRTLQLTSLRDGTAVHQTANRAIAQQIVRIASRSERTCLSCLAQHGDVIWDSERDAGQPVPRVNDHHSGRCTSVMIVKGRARTIQSGEEWFASLPEERQRQQASFIQSPGKYEAWKAGRVRLRDFVEPYEDRVFGEMIREASLTAALAK